MADSEAELRYGDRVMRIFHTRSGAWRRVLLTLATLALAMKIMVPPGFMPGPPVNDSLFALVICTGEGPMVVIEPGQALPSHGDRDDPSPEPGRDYPCVYAAHGLGDAPPRAFRSVDPIVLVDRARGTPPAIIRVAVASGPPLPARGPPLPWI